MLTRISRRKNKFKEIKFNDCFYEILVKIILKFSVRTLTNLPWTATLPSSIKLSSFITRSTSNSLWLTYLSESKPLPYLLLHSDLTHSVVDLEGIGVEICVSLNNWRKPDVYQEKGDSWKQHTQADLIWLRGEHSCGVGENSFTRCSLLHRGLNPSHHF